MYSSVKLAQLRFLLQLPERDKYSFRMSKKLREIGLMLTSDASVLTSSWKTSDVTFALSFSNCSIKCGTTSSGFPFLTTSPLENTLVYNYVEFVQIKC